MNKSEDHARLQLKTNRIYLISLSNSDRLNIRKRRVDNCQVDLLMPINIPKVDRCSSIRERFLRGRFLRFPFSIRWGLFVDWRIDVQVGLMKTTMASLEFEQSTLPSDDDGRQRESESEQSEGISQLIM